MTAPDAQRLPGTKRPAFAVRAMRHLWRMAVDPAFRHLMWLRLMRPKSAFQPFNETRPNRYPQIFGFVQAQLGADAGVKILSYGCSTGEEVFSLRDYFPRAAIKGIDINAGNIAVCRRRVKEMGAAALSFETASSTRAEPAASYDAIFAMAVLRHGDLALPGVTRCDHLIRFADFAAAVDDFKRCLKPGGLLIVRHSNFRLCDAPAATDFDTILSAKIPDTPKKTPLFGPDNLLMTGVEYPDTVFRKKTMD
jgi:SAM-dependent methyltransferase